MAPVACVLHPRSAAVPLANQAATPGRTTLLEAVNTLLAVIGEQPVNSIDTQQIVEASMAERTLLEFHRDGQQRGWHWNREEGYEFARNASGEVVVPANLIRWVPDHYQFDGRYQLRGQRVYDRQEHSYQINEASIKADVVWMLSWDECPEVFNRWTTIRSARAFAGRVLGDSGSVQFTAMDEQAARVELERAEMEHEQPNSLTGGPGLRPFPTFSPGLGVLGRNRGYLRG